MDLRIEERVAGEIEASSEAFENLLVLADDIGPRVAGSEGVARARDFLADSLRRYGLDEVRVEAFPLRVWHADREELRVMSPVKRDLVCRCAGLSPSTPPAGVEGEIAFLERCDRKELEERHAEVEGRIAVAPYYPYARQLKTPLAARHGAVALLEYRTFPGGLQPARTCAFQRLGDIPVASISLEDAEYLRRLAARKGRVAARLRLDSRVEPGDCWNVVGELRGSLRPEEIIVVGGHYDTWHVGPGAIDNAAGVVAVLEAARGLARCPQALGRTVRFVFFGAEESGLVGSWAYARQHADEFDDTVLMVNNDVGGRPAGLSIAGFPELEPALEQVAARVQVEGREERLAVSGGTPSWGSDHFPFLAHGVPTVGIVNESVLPEDRMYGHSCGDAADKVYARGLTECAIIDARIACQVGQMEARPAPRKSRQEVESVLAEDDLRGALDLLDLWPPEHVAERYL